MGFDGAGAGQEADEGVGESSDSQRASGYPSTEEGVLPATQIYFC